MTTPPSKQAPLSTSDDGTVYSSLATPRASVASQSAPTSGGGGSIFTSMASLLGLQLEKKFFCQICLDETLVSQCHTLSACGHRFCSSCLQSYLAFHIQEGETELQCFFQETTTTTSEADSACLTSIPLEEIRQLVDARTFAKWTRFRFNKQYANARQCPYCDHSQLCGDTIGQDNSSDCVCESCERVFCFVHGNAHAGEACRAYTKRTRKDDARNLAAINRLCRACPGCGQLVEKDGGCNQIKCWACKTSFCWICREVIDEAAFPTHYQWWIVGGCNGSQETSVSDSSAWERRTLAVLKGLLVVVFGPPAFVLAAVGSVVGCCCLPCAKVYNVSRRQAFRSCVCVSAYIVMLPLLVLGAVFFLPCLSVAYCASPQSFTMSGCDDTAIRAKDKLPSADSPV